MKVRSFSVHIFAAAAGKAERFKMAVEVNAVPQKHERTNREYASAGDCLTSARHLVNEVSKQTK